MGSRRWRSVVATTSAARRCTSRRRPPGAWRSRSRRRIRERARSPRSALVSACSHPTRWQWASRRLLNRCSSTSAPRSRATLLRRSSSAEGSVSPGLWAIDGNAQLTDDPAALFADPVGSLLPVGGADHGHKGYCLALMIETLTQGLSGHGRAEAPTRWGASVHVQVTDPAAFAGAEEFLRETSSIAGRCREAPPMPGVDAVRVPGDRARERRAWAAHEGLTPDPSTLRALRSWASALGVE